MTEAQLQQAVIELAQLLGWKVAHFRPAKTAKGWRTPATGDGAGFPDLVIAKHGHVIFAELKTDKGKLSDAQGDWLDALGWGPADDNIFVWRPADWSDGKIERILRAHPSLPGVA